MSTQSVKYVVTADTKGAQNAFKKLQGSIKEFSKKIESVGKKARA